MKIVFGIKTGHKKFILVVSLPELWRVKMRLQQKADLAWQTLVNSFIPAWPAVGVA